MSRPTEAKASQPYKTNSPIPYHQIISVLEHVTHSPNKTTVTSTSWTYHDGSQEPLVRVQISEFAEKHKRITKVKEIPTRFIHLIMRYHNENVKYNYSLIINYSIEYKLQLLFFYKNHVMLHFEYFHCMINCSSTVLLLNVYWQKSHS